MKGVIIGLFVLIAVPGACNRDSLDPEMPQVESIVVSPAISVLSVGSSLKLDAQVLNELGEVVIDRPVHWASEDDGIATVSGGGVVAARQVGTVQVAASTGGRSGLAQITVTITPVASVQVSPGNKALFVEESFQFNAETRDAQGNVLTGRPVIWTSNNESVATVSSSGLVTALSPGGAIISATSEGRSTPASITVSAVPVASIQLTPRTLTMVDGQAGQLQARPLDASGKPVAGRVVLWFTNNATVATVNANGRVVGQSPGSAVITATSEGKSATTNITVKPPAPNAVVITPGQAVVQEAATVQLSASVLDGQGQVIPGATVSYSSSDAAIATVSSSGMVSGVKPGRATITATSGGKTGTADVTVTPTPVSRVAVTPAQPAVVVGRSLTLSAQGVSATGQPLTGRTVSWSSSAPNVADVNGSGVVTGITAGNAVIFAGIDGVLGWANVTVVPAPVATATVSPSSSTVPIGQTGQLSAELRDAAGNLLAGRVVAWSSTRTSVASVTTAGVVTGVSAGMATITAMSEGQAGTATVTVVASGDRTVTVTPSSATIAPLGTVTLTATVRGPSGTIVTAPVTWSTSNGLVARVSSAGVVSGLLPGTAIITARSNNTTGTATITVK